MFLLACGTAYTFYATMNVPPEGNASNHSQSEAAPATDSSTNTSSNDDKKQQITERRTSERPAQRTETRPAGDSAAETTPQETQNNDEPEDDPPGLRTQERRTLPEQESESHIASNPLREFSQMNHTADAEPEDTPSGERPLLRDELAAKGYMPEFPKPLSSSEQFAGYEQIAFAPPAIPADIAPKIAKDRSSITIPESLAKIAPMVELPGGTFRMGSDSGGLLDQRPAHLVVISSFQLDQYQVTNRQFQLFVDATGYQTTVEQQGWGYVFDFDQREWGKMTGASWRKPDGKTPLEETLLDHPVTQVSWIDANAFCRWAGKRLPTEAEWEYAARGGLVDNAYPWGEHRMKDGKYMANDWQGWFPQNNTGDDGFLLTSPVGSFACNPFGLHDMAGNVWEWCHDWYSPQYYQFSPKENPQGPDQPDSEHAGHVVRGGSFLSSDNNGGAIRVTVRSYQPEKAGYQDVGFRAAE